MMGRRGRRGGRRSAVPVAAAGILTASLDGVSITPQVDVDALSDELEDMQLSVAVQGLEAS